MRLLPWIQIYLHHIVRTRSCVRCDASGPRLFLFICLAYAFCDAGRTRRQQWCIRLQTALVPMEDENYHVLLCYDAHDVMRQGPDESFTANSFTCNLYGYYQRLKSMCIISCVWNHAYDLMRRRPEQRFLVNILLNYFTWWQTMDSNLLTSYGTSACESSNTRLDNGRLFGSVLSSFLPRLLPYIVYLCFNSKCFASIHSEDEHHDVLCTRSYAFCDTSGTRCLVYIFTSELVRLQAAVI